jgi:ribulose-phosphate 3-epimerase
MAEIIPVILSSTIGDYQKKLKAVEPFTDWIQIDFVDGHFAPNKTIGPKEIKSIRTIKNLEIHLMVRFIEEWIDQFIKISTVKRVIFPIETAFEPVAIISHLKRHNVAVGACLNPETSIERVKHVLNYLDMILILSVYPGFSGQHFVHKSLQKISELRKLKPDITVEVDGGIQPGTARHCVEMGANILVANSFIFDNKDVDGETYQEKVKNALAILKEDIDGVVPIVES